MATAVAPAVSVETSLRTAASPAGLDEGSSVTEAMTV